MAEAKRVSIYRNAKHVWDRELHGNELSRCFYCKGEIRKIPIKVASGKPWGCMVCGTIYIMREEKKGG